MSENPERFGESAGLVDMDEFPKWIIYEDSNYLALDKPGWLVCHPSKNGPLSSLVGAARVYLNAEILHPVSRLDRETSGVVVVAKNHESASKAQKAVSEKGAVKKKYLAFLEGFLGATATVSQPLADDKHSIVAIKTCCAIQKPSAKSACTIFRPISHSNSPDGDFTLCEVELLTGRKHQIRAHAQWLGHSVAGDKLYGPDETLYLDFAEKGFTEEMSKILPIKRQALHAFEMDFGASVPELKLRAPLAEDLVSFAKKYRIEIPEKYLKA